MGTFGLFRFTLEGRAAPALYGAGWIATLLGGGTAFVSLLAGRTTAGGVLFAIGLAVTFAGLLFLAGSQAIERRRAGAAYAGPSPVLVLAAVLVGWYLAAIVALTPFVLLGATLDGPPLALVGAILQGIVVVLVLRVVVVGEGISWAAMGWTRPSAAALREFVWGAAFAIPVIVVTALVIYALVLAIGQQPASPLPPTGSEGGLLLNLVTGAIVAPIYEELFFRGFAQTAWRATGTARRAILRSAVLFAAVHIVGQSGDSFGQAAGIAVVAAGSRLPVAIALGAIFERRGSLWASIGLHATFNALLLVLAERAIVG